VGVEKLRFKDGGEVEISVPFLIINNLISGNQYQQYMH